VSVTRIAIARPPKARVEKEDTSKLKAGPRPRSSRAEWPSRSEIRTIEMLGRIRVDKRGGDHDAGDQAISRFSIL